MTRIRKKSRLLIGALGFIFCTLSFPIVAAHAETPTKIDVTKHNQNIEPRAKDASTTDSQKDDVNLLKKSDSHNSQDALPANVLTADLMYQILSGEMAEQRGLNSYAYEAMLDAAEKTRDPRLARRAAEIAVKRRDINEAVKAVTLWHRLAPDSTEAEKYWLGFLVLDNRLDDVYDYYASKLSGATKENRIAILYQLHQLLGGAKSKSEAYRIMERIIEPYRDMPEAHLSLALAALRNADQLRAKEEAGQALQLKPDSELAVLTYAQVSTNQEEAIRILADFVARYPDAKEVRLSLARMYLAQKQYPRARTEFRQLLQKDPKNPMVLYSLGLLEIQQGEYGAAEKFLNDYLEVSPEATSDNKQDQTQVLFLLAQVAEEQRQYDRALQWLGRIDLDEDDDSALEVEIKKAHIYAKKGDLNRSRRIMRELDNENPYEHEKILLSEAQILRDVKKSGEALSMLQAASEQFPKSANILYDYALTAETLKKYDVMENALKRVIKLDPKYQQAYNALGYSLADRNLRLQEAYTLIEKATELAPEDPYIMDSLGWVNYRLGNIDVAEETLRNAYMLRAEHEIAIHLAEVLWVKGNHQESLTLFRDVKKKSPDNEMLQETLNRLHIKL